MNEECAKIEAILFACGEPVRFEKLADFLKISKKETEDEIGKLKSFYRDNKTGLQILTKVNTIQLVSDARFGEEIAKVLDKRINEPLTKAAMEVLSVIAYRGPITRLQIEHIRGVNCSFMIRNLAIRGLIERGEIPISSRSYQYQVSYDFLKSMGFEEIAQLPDYELLSKTELQIKEDRNEEGSNK